MMRCVGLVTHGEKNTLQGWWVKLKKSNLLEYQCTEMRIILKWVLKK